jgi:hypothetical protein
MTAIDVSKVAAYLAAGDQARATQATTAQGRALEDLIVYLFGLIPGITLTVRNELDAFRSEEIDVAFWNEEDPSGLRQFDHIILVECKNWSSPVGSKELIIFDSKLEERGRLLGIFVAAAGITGDPKDLTAAYSSLSKALQKGREIIVLTRGEIEQLTETSQLVRLLKQKRLQLAVSGTIFRMDKK